MVSILQTMYWEAVAVSKGSGLIFGLLESSLAHENRKIKHPFNSIITKSLCNIKQKIVSTECEYA